VLRSWTHYWLGHYPSLVPDPRQTCREYTQTNCALTGLLGDLTIPELDGSDGPPLLAQPTRRVLDDRLRQEGQLESAGMRPGALAGIPISDACRSAPDLGFHNIHANRTAPQIILHAVKMGNVDTSEYGCAGCAAQGIRLVAAGSLGGVAVVRAVREVIALTRERRWLGPGG
jgi:hypothetical protein